MGLAAEAHVGRPLDGEVLGRACAERLPALGLQLGEHRRRAPSRSISSSRQELGAHPFHGGIGGDQADAGGDPAGAAARRPARSRRCRPAGRRAWARHRRTPTSVNWRGSMPRWMVTTRMAAAMVGVGDVVHGPRRVSARSSPSGAATSRSMRLAAAVGRERHARRAAPRVEVAEHQVGVGHGRLGRRRGRSRPGPGTAPAERGPDAQGAAGVDPGDAAAAGADLGQVDDRDLEREARCPAALRRSSPCPRPGSHG